MEIRIRPVTYGDAEQYVKLNVHVWSLAYKDTMPAEVLQNRKEKQNFQIENFKNRDINKNGHIDYAAEVDGKIVGQASGRIVSNHEYFKTQGYAELNALYVHPDFQHMGIGAKLVQAFMKQVREYGGDKFVIGVLKDNAKARKAYEKWGGKLSEYAGEFEVAGQKFPEVYYTYKIKEN